MNKLLLASAAIALTAGMAHAEDVKLGIIFGFTGPLESITPTMAAGAELAVAEVNASGLFDGTVSTVRTDSTCVDAAAAQAAAEALITSDGVKALIGPDCSGVAGVVLQNVARPNGIGMISSSATSPGLSTAEDDGLFFRTAPSDARQGEIVAEIIHEKGIGSVAITYSNNDYGKGLADSIGAAFEALGGTVTLVAPHEDGKADYSAEVAALAAAGGDMLVVAGYADQGGKGMIQASVDTGAFEAFFLPDGMYGESLVNAIGAPLNGSLGAVPGTDSNGAEIFQGLATTAGFDGQSAYAGESYDAAALILLAMAKAGSSNAADWTPLVMDIANGPGEPILPGELAKALELIKAGTDIDYVGATALEFVEPGESAGSYREYEIVDGTISTVGYR